MDAPNPLLSPSPLPHGLPPFADILEEHFEPAFEAGIAEQISELEAIVSGGEPATFANTMVPLERSGQTLRRVEYAFWTLTGTESTAFLRDLEERIAPMLAAHQDAILLNASLYRRITAVRETIGSSPSDTAEMRHLVEQWHRRMMLAGAALDEAAKQQVSRVNQRLSELQSRFESRLLEDTNSLAVVFDDAAELDGLGDSERSAAEAAAKARGLDGRLLLALVLPTSQPALAQLASADARARLMWASRERGAHGGEFDTRETLLEIVRLRAHRARILGFRVHADVATAEETAGSSAAVATMLEPLAPIAAENARRELAELEALAGTEVRAADWPYWAEQLRAQRYALDTASLRPWFEAERVLRDGVFYAATRLYGVSFTERPDLRGWNADTRVFEVRDEDGSTVGLYLLDLYTRDAKRGGAWMHELVTTASLLGQDTAVVANNLNVPKPAAGEPTLLTLDEVSTLFHEFGHALHGLFARATFPSLAGTTHQRDFVEFPSQVNEMWMLWPEVLDHYARHVETGEPLPLKVVSQLRATETFNQGYLTSEYLAAALLDQAWHTLTAEEAEAVQDVGAFEARALARVGLDNPAVPPRYQSSYFQHTFGGGYDARYYGYIWSEVLDADTVEWFKTNGGLTRANGQRFRERLLAVGGTKDPLAAYRDFRGRDAVIEPLLRRRGLA